MRLRRLLLILGACWIVFGTAWVARRWWAVRILENRAAAYRSPGGFVGSLPMPEGCEWTFAYTGPFSGHPMWLKLLPTSAVTAFRARSRIPDDADFAWALRVCGRLEVLSIDPIFSDRYNSKTAPPPDPRALRTFLTALGSQPALQELELSLVNLRDEEFAPLLRQFPHLRILSLEGTNYSCADFPPLPALQEIYLGASPVSDAGLAALLRCPALATLTIAKGLMTKAGLQQIPQLRQPALQDFEIAATPGITQSEASALTDAIRAACPGLFFELNYTPIDNVDLPPPNEEQ